MKHLFRPLPPHLRPIALALGVFGAWLGWGAAAHADAISIGILGLLGYSGAGGLLAPTAVLGTVLFNSVVAAIPGILLSAALSVGATLLLNALRPQPQQASPGERLVNLRQTIQDRTRSYGLVRVGGPVGFWKASGGARYAAILLNTGEVNAYQQHYLDDTPVSIDGSGYVTGDRFNPKGTPAIQIEAFRGQSGQGASGLLSGAFAEWTPDHVFAGIATAVVRFANVDAEDFTSVYPGGRELTYTALIQGTKCLDPRDGDIVWTTNAALVLGDWLASAEGLGAEIDTTILAEEADAADVTMLDRDGDTIKTWELCGTYSFGDTRESVRTAMATACDAYFFETDEGKVAFRLGRWTEPQFTITDAHILSAQIAEGQDGTTRPNAVAVKYTDPATGYREQLSAAFYEADGEAYNEEQADAYWVPKHTQAVKLAKRILRQARAQFDVQLRLNLYGLVLRDQRFFRLEFDELAVSCFVEIADWRFADDGLSVTVTGKSVLAADFAFDAATEEPAPSTVADVSTDLTIADPTGVAISSPGAGSLRVDFDPPLRPGLVARVRYRVVGNPDWITVSLSTGATFGQVNGLAADDYEAEAEWRTAALESNWVAATPSSVTVS